MGFHGFRRISPFYFFGWGAHVCFFLGSKGGWWGRVGAWKFIQTRVQKQFFVIDWAPVIDGMVASAIEQNSTRRNERAAWREQVKSRCPSFALSWLVIGAWLAGVDFTLYLAIYWWSASQNAPPPKTTRRVARDDQSIWNTTQFARIRILISICHEGISWKVSRPRENTDGLLLLLRCPPCDTSKT